VELTELLELCHLVFLWGSRRRLRGVLLLLLLFPLLLFLVRPPAFLAAADSVGDRGGGAGDYRRAGHTSK
jgi:hypothetical protein